VVAQLLPQPHPILACAEQVMSVVGGVRQVQPVFMSPVDKTAAVVELGRAISALQELQLRVLASAEDVAMSAGARDVGSWAAFLTHADPAVGRADARLAEALDRSWGRVAAGMATGMVAPAQARVVVHALEALPDHLDPDIVVKAEAQLVAWCGEFNPTQLRRLGRHILDVVAPEIADAEEAKRLEDEEQAAREKCRLSFKPTGDGSTRIFGLLPDPDADRLRTYLEAFTSPRKTEGTLAAGEEDRIPYARKLGQAFCALLEHLDPKKLPAHGGDATTVMVTITLDSLRAELGTGAIVGGEPLSATAIRRLACQADIIPVVLGGKGEILDLGRSRRLFSPAQRKAMRLRDQRCRAEGCSIPARWCEAHHQTKPWSQGGKTDLDDGILHCKWHHHRAHDPRYHAEKLPNGDVRFSRRR